MQRLIPVPRRLLPSVLQYLTPDEGQLRECLECHKLLPDHRIYYTYHEELAWYETADIEADRRNYTLIFPCTRRPETTWPHEVQWYCHACWDRWHRSQRIAEAAAIAEAERRSQSRSAEAERRLN